MHKIMLFVKKKYIFFTNLKETSLYFSDNSQGVIDN